MISQRPSRRQSRRSPPLQLLVAVAVVGQLAGGAQGQSAGEPPVGRQVGLLVVRSCCSGRRRSPRASMLPPKSRRSRGWAIQVNQKSPPKRSQFKFFGAAEKGLAPSGTGPTSRRRAGPSCGPEAPRNRRRVSGCVMSGLPGLLEESHRPGMTCSSLLPKTVKVPVAVTR